MICVAITMLNKKTIMNNPNQSALRAIDKSTQPARNNGVTRAVGLLFAATTDWLRQQHEIALRLPPAAARMPSANATPA